ncbi:MAG: nucleoside triphosphate pyrophosphohydrolase [Micavibrio sp.]
MNIMAALRDPQSGCPWDLEQNFATIAPYTIEEAYEVADAIRHNDMDGLKEELGDLLLQVVFHTRMAEEQELFDFNDVAQALCEKLVYRHPHVFGDDKAANADEVLRIWNARKQTEKNHESAVDGVTIGLPALMRAAKLQKKAARSGFTWKDSMQAMEKLDEEYAELRSAITQENTDKDAIADEIGDVIFCLANIARLEGLDAEEILQKTNEKFIARFKAMEKILAAGGRKMDECTLADLLEGWNKAKNTKI